MPRLGELRSLRSQDDPAGPTGAGAASHGDIAVDPSRTPGGHIFSPAIRQQQKELGAKMAEVPQRAAEAKAEFDRLYAEGFELHVGGNGDGAMERFAAAYVLAREMNYRSGEADALNMTGVLYKERGELERAVAVFEGCAKLCASLRDAQAQAAALGNLGQALAAQRQIEQAEGAHARSLALARGVSDMNGELAALFHLGTLLLRQRRFGEAEAYLAQAEALAVRLRDVAAEVGVLQRLAAARGARIAAGEPVPVPGSGGSGGGSGIGGSGVGMGCSGSGAPNSSGGFGGSPSMGVGNGLSASLPLSSSSRAALGGAASLSLGASLGAGRGPVGARPSPSPSPSLDARGGPPAPPSRFRHPRDHPAVSGVVPFVPLDAYASTPLAPIPSGAGGTGTGGAGTSLSPPPPPPPRAPPAPLAPAPLALLVRAERLTRELEESSLDAAVSEARPLRLQVLRQLRGQYLLLGDEPAASACEREIDAVHRRDREAAEAAANAERPHGVLV
jgi:hypothetical protein